MPTVPILPYTTVSVVSSPSPINLLSSVMYLPFLSRLSCPYHSLYHHSFVQWGPEKTIRDTIYDQNFILWHVVFEYCSYIISGITSFDVTLWQHVDRNWVILEISVQKLCIIYTFFYISARRTRYNNYLFLTYSNCLKKKVPFVPYIPRQNSIRNAPNTFIFQRQL